MMKALVPLALFLVLLPSSAWSAKKKKAHAVAVRAFRIQHLDGKVWLSRGSKSSLLTGEMVLRSGDRITTGSNSSAEVHETQGPHWLRLSSTSVIRVDRGKLEFQYGLGLLQGEQLKLLSTTLKPGPEARLLVAVARNEDEHQARLAGNLPPLPEKFPDKELTFGRVAVVKGAATLANAKKKLELSAGDQATIYAEEGAEIRLKRISTSELKALISTLGISQE